ncbi:hypothetical protein [Variovorax sp. JS1663]|uniref:hypothetical protein n=1 Tax=Variovorax sp. JS1663 TaxID=1851577 RepID=UPI00117D3B63|nr:hypothetical protein [Variovorax sp. JS1663]
MREREAAAGPAAAATATGERARRHEQQECAFVEGFHTELQINGKKKFLRLQKAQKKLPNKSSKKERSSPRWRAGVAQGSYDLPIGRGRTDLSSVH